MDGKAAPRARLGTQCHRLLPAPEHWNHRITVSLTMILPLPKGEGRGEGGWMQPVVKIYII